MKGLKMLLLEKKKKKKNHNDIDLKKGFLTLNKVYTQNGMQSLQNK